MIRTGNATYYDATGAGNCGFDPSPGDLRVTAMNAPDYANSAVCGAYLAVSGPRGNVTVRVTDRCPECPTGHLDLSQQAFARIADPVAGRVPIRWQLVAGDVQGPVQYRYKEGSSRYWVALQVRNHRWPVTALEIRPAGATAWTPVARMDYNYFVYPQQIAEGPLQVRITAVTGAVLIDTLPAPASALQVAGGGQFP